MGLGLRTATRISSAMTLKQEGVLKKCEECGQVILEKGIPVPGGRRDRWNILSQMEIGDSLITTTDQDFEKVRAAMRYRGMEYRSRKEPNGTGYRLWRIG
jgi:hypothetical protein